MTPDKSCQPSHEPNRQTHPALRAQERRGMDLWVRHRFHRKSGRGSSGQRRGHSGTQILSDAFVLQRNGICQIGKRNDWAPEARAAGSPRCFSFSFVAGGAERMAWMFGAGTPRHARPEGEFPGSDWSRPPTPSPRVPRPAGRSCVWAPIGPRTSATSAASRRECTGGRRHNGHECSP